MLTSTTVYCRSIRPVSALYTNCPPVWLWGVLSQRHSQTLFHIIQVFPTQLRYKRSFNRGADVPNRVSSILCRSRQCTDRIAAGRSYNPNSNEASVSDQFASILRIQWSHTILICDVWFERGGKDCLVDWNRFIVTLWELEWPRIIFPAMTRVLLDTRSNDSRSRWHQISLSISSIIHDTTLDFHSRQHQCLASAVIICTAWNHSQGIPIRQANWKQTTLISIIRWAVMARDVYDEHNCFKPG